MRQDLMAGQAVGDTAQKLPPHQILAEELRKRAIDGGHRLLGVARVPAQKQAVAVEDVVKAGAWRDGMAL
ncbi:hypothetical protein FZ029_07400 [Azospirillum sp. Sh1]|nr:hypothetical protein FZ029_07400 [Azospirillum sp. Sh1]